MSECVSEYVRECRAGQTTTYFCLRSSVGDWEGVLREVCEGDGGSREVEEGSVEGGSREEVEGRVDGGGER